MDIPDFETILTGDPEQGLRTIMQDLERRLTQQGVKPNSLEGIRIVVQIAYRLGERAGIER